MGSKVEQAAPWHCGQRAVGVCLLLVTGPTQGPEGRLGTISEAAPEGRLPRGNCANCSTPGGQNLSSGLSETG